MPLQYLKKAGKTPDTESGAARKVVPEMLADIEKRGEAAVREYAARLDNWKGEILVAPAEVERRTRDIPAGVKRDIEFATEVAPGLVAGQRLVPVNVAGCYVPTGPLFSLTAEAVGDANVDEVRFAARERLA